MATLWFIMFIIAMCLFLAACWGLSQAQERVIEEKNIHESCHEAVEAVLRTASKRTDASALRAAADKWDSVENQTLLKRLGRDEYEPGGPSVPAIWLRIQANQMDPAIEADEGIHA